MPAWKLAPAIAAGCTCVLKPAEQTPLTALEVANWFDEVGLPPGVVNIVNGFGERAGAALVAHPRVDKIAFTGSAAVGKIIVKSAADTLKRVTLELGGKSPNIFFAEADWEAAVDGALFGVFINQGEVCSAGSRILVEKKIYTKFVESMTEKAKRIKLGPPLDRETKMGPLVSKEQYDRVQSYLEIGKKEAKVAIGGGRPKKFKKGYYLKPTIFYDVENSARIAREEIFGPVAFVISFDGEADAIRIANDTPYGLAAGGWRREIYKAVRVVKSLRGGIGCLNVGHQSPRVISALREQMEKHLHLCFAVTPYESYVALSEKLNALTPGRGPKKTIIVNTGAEAVENAVKIARAYTKRPAVICFEDAFHGRTLLTMTLTSKTHPYNAGFEPFASGVYRIPFAYSYRSQNGATA